MSSGLIRVAYISSNAIELDSDAMIDAINDILVVSQENNKKVGVTGALLFNQGFFGQILEGPTEAVEETFERIQNDDRHHSVTLLDAKPITELSFNNWSMGFVGADDVLKQVAHQKLDTANFDLTSLSGDEMFSLLSTLAIDRELSNTA